MTFNDIFKSSFLESVTEFSVVDTLIGLAFALVIGLYIFMVYKKTLTGVLYSESFALTLVGLSCVTALVIMAVTSNVVLSLGMVGALSIVRFRAAIKEPIEIVFLFWAIAAGIVVGAGMIPLALIGSVAIGAIMILMVNRKSVENPYIAVIRCRDHASEIVATEYLRSHVSSAQIKSKSAQEGMIELNYEVRLKGDDTDFISALSDQQGVISAVLVSYNGDYMG